MRGGKAFFDTNILVYAFTRADRRAPVAEALLRRPGLVGIQTLNEFVAIATTKLRMNWHQVLEALSLIREVCPSTPVPVTVATHERALQIVGLYRYHIYDSLMIAAALEASCETFYSEDLHDGQVIDGLTIRNPFLG